MSDKSPSTAIKISLSKSEISDVDRAIADGLGKSRADVCRKALILYLASFGEQGDVM